MNGPFNLIESARRVDPQSVVDETRITWAIRNRYNPLRGLTPEVLTVALESFKIGFIRQCVLLWEAMANRDATLRTVIGKRTDALVGLNRAVQKLDDSPEASLHQEYLEAFYAGLQVTDVLEQDQRGGAELLVKKLAGAIGLRYACLEILWKPGLGSRDTTALLNHVPAWFFENRSGRLRYLPTDFTIYGNELVRRNWCIAVGAGLMEPSSIAYLFKNLALGDWANFSEKFGIPAILAKTTHSKGSDGWNAALSALTQFQAEFAAVTDKDTAIELIEPKSGSSNLPQPPLVQYMDDQMIMLWRGGDLSTKSKGGDAIGANAQEEESFLMLKADAEWVTGTLRHQLDLAVLQYGFGDDVQPKAGMALVVPEPKNTTQDIAVDRFMLELGIALDRQKLLDRYDRTEETQNSSNAITAPALGQADAQGQPRPAGNNGGGGRPAGGSQREASADTQNDQPGSGSKSKPGKTNGRYLSPEDLRRAIETANAINSSDELTAVTEERLAAHLVRLFAPLKAKIEAVAALTDPMAQRNALSALKVEVINEIIQANADPGTEAIFEKALVAALEEGFKASST